MKIAVVAFGKLRTPGLLEAQDYFKSMISAPIGSGRACKFEIVELKPENVRQKSEAERKRIQTVEGQTLIKTIEGRFGNLCSIILMDEAGKGLPTREWAVLLQNSADRGEQPLVFCIGSSLGFSDETRKRAKYKLNLGPQTLAHELARIVLLEQIYRSLSLLGNHPYHNEGS